jgi:hypothetical protein
MGGGAVLLAVAAFLLGHSTARASSSPADATTLSALSSATTATTNAPCAGGPHQGTAGTLKSKSGTTLTVTTPKGTDVTVKTDGNTKVTKVVTAALGDVAKGTVVAVHGTANGTTIAADHVGILPAAAANPSGPGPGGAPPGAGRPFGPKAQAAGVALGTVQSVTSSGFTLSSGGTTITVTTSSSTVFAKTVTATVNDLVTGQPIAVAGTPNSDGSITAASVAQSTIAGGLGKLPGFGFGFGLRGPRGRPAGSP